MSGSRKVFAARRAKIRAALGDGVLVLPAAPVTLRNNDVEHDYRQDSDFFYLTGFDEPQSWVVLSGSQHEAFSLFVRPRDKERETWDGLRLGVEGAKAELGADAVFPIAELAEKLPTLLRGHRRLFYELSRGPAEDALVLDAVRRTRQKARRGGIWPTEIIEPGTILHEQRLRKAPEEIALMRRAAEISAEAHTQAMRRCQPGMAEYEIEAVLHEIFLSRGARRTAYSSIVASGENATILHYRQNTRRFQAGELLLIDAGCEFDYYASDITRTFPVSGTFSEPQRAVYEVVLNAQLAAIEAVRPGATLDDVHRAAVTVITQGLIDLGIITGPLETAIEEERFKPFYMHRTSHYLGMDVHDVGLYYDGEAPRPLEAGFVITVEPGLYFRSDADNVDAAFRGIGIRIEDDVLVTPEGVDVLSRDVPKTVDDVERACRA